MHTPHLQASDPELRPTWRLNVDYYTMLLGATVGLSNVLMFPSVAASNGGLAFVFLYFVMAVCVGMPLVYLEVSWGQFCSRGPIQCYNISPLFKGKIQFLDSAYNEPDWSCLFVCLGSFFSPVPKVCFIRALR